MSEERKRILKMLVEGKISLDEADELLSAFQQRESTGSTTPPLEPVTSVKTKARFLRVRVSDSGNEKVNVRVPLALVSAGMKFTSLLPEEARAKVQEAMQSKGIPFDINRMKPEELIAVIEDLDIEVKDGGDHVRVYCE